MTTWSYPLMSPSSPKCSWFLILYACSPGTFTNKSNTKALSCESCVCPAHCSFKRKHTILFRLCQDTWINPHQYLSTKCNITSLLLQLDGMLYSAKQSHGEFWKMPCWRQVSGKPWLNETNTPNCSQMHLQSVSALLSNSTNLLPMTIHTNLPLTWNSESRHY